MNLFKSQSLTVLFNVLFFMFFLGADFQLLCQTPVQAERIQGVVIDSTTAQAIPQVSIWTHHSHTTSDADGNFSLFVSEGDSLHFSHVSYHDLTIKLDSKKFPARVVISLRQKVILLSEVKIYSFLSENAFKKKIMETIPVLSREEQIAQINSMIMTYVARYAPAAPMNAYDNYIEYMKGPQDVIILSTNPSKGLIRAIKNVVRPNSLSYKRFLGADSARKMIRFR